MGEAHAGSWQQSEVFRPGSLWGLERCWGKPLAFSLTLGNGLPTSPDWPCLDKLPGSPSPAKTCPEFLIGTRNSMTMHKRFAMRSTSRSPNKLPPYDYSMSISASR